MVGEKRLDTFGPLPVRDGGGPVERRLPLVPGRVADPFRRCPVVHVGGTIVRLGRVPESLRAGGQHLRGGNVRLGRISLGRGQPLPGSGGPVTAGVRASFSECPEPGADGVKPGVDLLPTLQREPALALHVS